MQNWPQTVISQYTNSTSLLALLESIDEWISPDANFEAFYNLIWNVDTAVGYGLDVWGRIVGIVRTVTITNNYYFGFAQANDPTLVGTWGEAGSTPSGHAPFYSGEPVTKNFVLADDAFRKLIFAKAAANITNGSIQSINAILMNILFPGRGNAYVVDGLNMTMTYAFDFPLQPFEVSIVVASGVLPRSTGVHVLYSYTEV